MSGKISFLAKRIEDNYEKSVAIISSYQNRLYYSEFSSSDGLILVTAKQSYLLLDARYYFQAKKTVNEFEVILCDNLFEGAMNLIKKHFAKNIFIEQSKVSVKDFLLLEKLLKSTSANLINNIFLDDSIQKQREIKTFDEINKIKIAQQITEEAFNHILPFIKPGVSEVELSTELEFFMKKNGTSDIAFPTIVLSGQKTAYPHGAPDENQIKNGDFVLIDMGATYKGYNSDMTRTVAVVKIDNEKKEIYNLVLQAKKIATKSIKHGLPGKLIDKTVREYFKKAHYGEKFCHSLGHGVGIDIHETPSISSKSNCVITPGMVFTIEPGIYINNKFGVRIEDMIHVTDFGIKNLTSISDELIIV